MDESYRDPDRDGKIRDTFAAPEVEQWERAVNDLREILHTLDDANLNRRDERQEAEEALFNRLPETDMALRDAWDAQME